MVLKRIAIIGLGLMGGSLAYALRGFASCVIIGYDTNEGTLQQAKANGAIDTAAESLMDAVTGADVVLFCSSPSTTILNVLKSMPYLKSGCIISEICGVKKDIFATIMENLPEGVEYIGLHPMAGKEVGGFINADASLYQNAGFIMVLPEKHNADAVTFMKALLAHIGAGRVVYNTPREHDDIIAYTSDLMHVAAVALCASYPHSMTMAHTAGSFRDCTRIATIDADLWTELFTENAESVLPHLRQYIDNLQGFEKALLRDDKTFIHAFLRKATENKQAMLNK